MGVRRIVYAGVLLVAAAGIFACIWTARARTQAAYDRAHAAQAARLERLQTATSDFFLEAAQTLRIDAAIGVRVAGNRALVESLLGALMQERRSRSIYGLGFFFAPDPSGALYGPYYKSTRAGFSLMRNTDRQTYDYTKLAWYRLAERAPDTAIIDGPYDELGQRYISILQGVRVRGRFIGVASVDTRLRSFVAMMRSPLTSTDIAFVTSRNGDVHVKTAPLPADRSQWHEISVPMRFTHSRLHLLSRDSAPLTAARRNWSYALGVSIAIALLAILIAELFARLGREREAHEKLQREMQTRREVEARLREAAFVDELTGLPNRAHVREHLGRTILRGEPFSVVLIDVDGFTLVNETFGHAAGDELLRAIARRLRDAGRGETSRVGADEFCVVFGQNDTRFGIQDLVRLVNGEYEVGGVEYHLTASSGIVRHDPAYAEADDYLRDAEIALFAAKRRGRGRSAVFEPAMRRRVQEDIALEVQLRAALDNGELRPYYQPIVDAQSGEIRAFEALVRWQSPQNGLLGAEAFVEFAERRALIAQIDNAVLAQVGRDAPALLARHPAVSLAVNVSPAHLSDERLIPEVLRAIQSAGMTPSQLYVEITETQVMRNPERAMRVLHELQDVGIRVVIDDFGVGQSSLAYLQRLPVWGMKIDRSFITPLVESVQAQEIVRSIVALAHALDLHLVAEGIESSQQANVLVSMGVRYLQGYLYSRPLPIEGVLALPAGGLVAQV